MIVSSRTPRKPPDQSEVVYLYSNGRRFKDPRGSGGSYATKNSGFILLEDQEGRAGLTGNYLLQENGDRLELE
jgi:hypothetical protein